MTAPLPVRRRRAPGRKPKALHPTGSPALSLFASWRFSFLFLAAAGGIFALLYSQLSVLSLPLFQLVPWALPALAAAVVAAAGTYISRQYRQHALKKAVQCRPHEAVRHHGYQRDYCLCGCLYRRRGGPGRRAGGPEHQIRHRRRLLQYPDHQRTGNFVGGPALRPRRL